MFSIIPPALDLAQEMFSFMKLLVLTLVWCCAPGTPLFMFVVDLEFWYVKQNSIQDMWEVIFTHVLMRVKLLTLM